MKYFCPSCENRLLTFSLRYLNFNEKKWKKKVPVETQYCEGCKKQYPVKECKKLEDYKVGVKRY
jgi:uncharacterized protein YbaR (Trm112 family)